MSDVLIRLSERELLDLVTGLEVARTLLAKLGQVEAYHNLSNLIEKLQLIRRGLALYPKQEVE